MKVKYSHNNSGGRWWLKDKHWLALEAAGWTVIWGGRRFCGSKYHFGQSQESTTTDFCPEGSDPNQCPGHRRFDSLDERGRFLGVAAQYAEKDFPSLRDAILEWEEVVGMDASDEGCGCCGPPHSFSCEGQYASGEDVVGILHPKFAGRTMREIAESGEV